MKNLVDWDDPKRFGRLCQEMVELATQITFDKNQTLSLLAQAFATAVGQVNDLYDIEN